MITELDKEKAQKEKLENGIRLCEDTIAKAEKYERLKDNKDWQGYLDDLKVLIGLHEREIKMGASMIPEAPFQSHIKHDEVGREVVVSSKEDWMDFISRHETQRAELSSWLKEPERIVAMAAMAREKLPMLRDKLAEIDSHVKEKPDAN